MGIYTPNVKKQNNCINCIAHQHYWYDEYTGPAYDYCRALGKVFNKQKFDIDPFKQTLSDCPLIEIDLVFCKDCKKSQCYTMDSNLPISRWCHRLYKPMAVQDYYFCNFGERETDE